MSETATNFAVRNSPVPVCVFILTSVPHHYSISQSQAVRLTRAFRQRRSPYNECGKTGAGRNYAKYDLLPLPAHIAGGLEVDVRAWCRTKY